MSFFGKIGSAIYTSVVGHKKEDCIDTIDAGKNWDGLKSVKHVVFGGEEGEVKGKKAFLYKYDGVVRALLGTTIGLVLKPLNNGENIFHSKAWKEYQRELRKKEDPTNPNQKADVLQIVVSKILPSPITAEAAPTTGATESAPVLETETDKQADKQAVESAPTTATAAVQQTQVAKPAVPPPVPPPKTDKQERVAGTDEQAVVSVLAPTAQAGATGTATVEVIEIPQPEVEERQEPEEVKELFKLVSQEIKSKNSCEEEESASIEGDLNRELLDALQLGPKLGLGTAFASASVSTLAGLAMYHPELSQACYKAIQDKLGNGIEMAVKCSGELTNYSMELVLKGASSGIEGIKIGMKELEVSMEQLQTFMAGFGEYAKVEMVNLEGKAGEMLEKVGTALRNIAGEAFKSKNKMIQNASHNISELGNSINAVINQDQTGLKLFLLSMGVYVAVKNADKITLLVESVIKNGQDFFKQTDSTEETVDEPLLKTISEFAVKYELALKLTGGTIATAGLAYVAYQNQEAIGKGLEKAASSAGKAVEVAQTVIKDNVSQALDNAMREISGVRAALEQLPTGEYIAYIQNTGGEIVGAVKGSLDDLAKVLLEYKVNIDYKECSETVMRSFIDLARQGEKLSTRILTQGQDLFDWAGKYVAQAASNQQVQALALMAFSILAVKWLQNHQNKASNKIEEGSSS